MTEHSLLVLGFSPWTRQKTCLAAVLSSVMGEKEAWESPAP